MTYEDFCCSENTKFHVICEGLYHQQFKTSANWDAATSTDIWMKRVCREGEGGKFQPNKKTQTPAERKRLMLSMGRIVRIPWVPWRCDSAYPVGTLTVQQCVSRGYPDGLKLRIPWVPWRSNSASPWVPWRSKTAYPVGTLTVQYWVSRGYPVGPIVRIPWVPCRSYSAYPVGTLMV